MHAIVRYQPAHNLCCSSTHPSTNHVGQAAEQKTWPPSQIAASCCCDFEGRACESAAAVVLRSHQSTLGVKGMPRSFCVQCVHLSCTACRCSRDSWCALSTRPRVMCMMLLCLLEAPARHAVSHSADIKETSAAYFDYTHLHLLTCIDISLGMMHLGQA